VIDSISTSFGFVCASTQSLTEEGHFYQLTKRL